MMYCKGTPPTEVEGDTLAGVIPAAEAEYTIPNPASLGNNMAKGRMLIKTLGESRKYAALQTDIARVVYPLILANADKAGRVEADPLYIARKICVRLPYTEQQIAESLVDMHRVGLILLYEVDDLPVLEVVDFQKHNTPHYKEPESTLPGPENGVQHENIQSQANVEPSLRQRQANVEPTFRLNRIEKNEIKENRREGEVEGELETPPPSIRESSEERFANRSHGSANDKHRVRATIRRIHADFARRNEDSMDAWSRWTDEQIHEFWELSDPNKWPDGNQKKRSWIFADLLNEDRQKPIVLPPRETEEEWYKRHGLQDVWEMMNEKSN